MHTAFRQRVCQEYPRDSHADIRLLSPELLQGMAPALVVPTVQAQGLVHELGPLDDIQHAIRDHHILLAAHGPYTAAGVEGVLAIPVTCISQDFSSFHGLVKAVETAISAG
ncbi:unnamed protein product [Ostreobium quekettii]|uniref:Uncharacterized protein n=1 Tax=Ostreobium quekettii TaxID=121088 RepID=A0A8S1IU76_9CHLO|nr:unnamed protein product [Ostreobium quekettii]